MHFAANLNSLIEVCNGKWLQRTKDSLPTLLPVIPDSVPGGVRLDDKLHVTVAIRFLTIARKEISPARVHVAGHVFHHHRNAVSFFIKSDKELFIFELGQGLLGKFLISAKR